jgi:putative transcriptional regulator
MDYFNELVQSLEKANAYKNGDASKARRRTVVALTAPVYQAQDIARLRLKLQLSQRGLASVLGVSGRTVEAW